MSVKNDSREQQGAVVMNKGLRAQQLEACVALSLILDQALVSGGLSGFFQNPILLTIFSKKQGTVPGTVSTKKILVK